jgi:hypothetical protein
MTIDDKANLFTFKPDEDDPLVAVGFHFLSIAGLTWAHGVLYCLV